MFVRSVATLPARSRVVTSRAERETKRNARCAAPGIYRMLTGEQLLQRGGPWIDGILFSRVPARKMLGRDEEEVSRQQQTQSASPCFRFGVLSLRDRRPMSYSREERMRPDQIRSNPKDRSTFRSNGT